MRAAEVSVPDIILHHYDGSPYGEKICTILGYKRVPWCSVRIPPALPRPLLAPLTGAHRRTPVLQHGADLYFDTRCIAAFLERTISTPTLFPPGGRFASELMACFAEPKTFVAMAPLRFRRAEDVDGIFGGAIDAVRFVADRTPFMRGALDVAQAAALVPAAWDQVQVFFAILDRALTAGGPYLCGGAASLADFSAYSLAGWLERGPRVSELLDRWPRVCVWLAEMARIGHGDVRRIGAEDALEQARRAEPRSEDLGAWEDPLGRKPGQRVQVTPDDYGRDATVGELIAASADEVVLRRDAPEVGALHLHFPRIGFQILPA
jgi:glutathione S-transferase